MRSALKVLLLLAFFCSPCLLYAQGYRLIAPTPPSVDSFINSPGITLPQVLDTLYAHLDPADTMDTLIARSTTGSTDTSGEDDAIALTKGNF